MLLQIQVAVSAVLEQLHVQSSELLLIYFVFLATLLDHGDEAEAFGVMLDGFFKLLVLEVGIAVLLLASRLRHQVLVA